jgi:hypothetical protein
MYDVVMLTVVDVLVKVLVVVVVVAVVVANAHRSCSVSKDRVSRGNGKRWLTPERNAIGHMCARFKRATSVRTKVSGCMRGI